MKLRTISLIWLFVSLLMLQGCGYHNPYTRNTDQNQPLTTVYVSVWDNLTNEMGLENLIFQKTADHLRQIRYLGITSEAVQADYILSGMVLGVDYPAASFDTTDTATTLTARIKVDYRLTERVSDKTIWQTTEIIRGDSYPVGADALRTQSNKKTVLETIANEIGEHIYLRITDTLTTPNGSQQ